MYCSASSRACASISSEDRLLSNSVPPTDTVYAVLEVPMDLSLQPVELYPRLRHPPSVCRKKLFLFVQMRVMLLFQVNFRLTLR